MGPAALRRRPVVHVPGLLALVLATVGGCAHFGTAPSWWPFRGPRDPKTASIVTPADRIAELRSTAERARRATPEEKQRLAEELGQSIRAEDDPLIRAEIVRVLGNCSCPKADALLRASTDDPSRDVRMAACRAWGEHGGANAAAVLSQVLTGDDDPDVRLAAVEALGQCRDPAAVAALGPALEDRDPAMQYRAVLALRDLTGEDFGNDVNRWRQYVQGEVPAETAPPSVAERLRRIF